MKDRPAMEERRAWTREELDAELPLPAGWVWGFQFVDADHDDFDQTRPWAFGQAQDGQAQQQS